MYVVFWIIFGVLTGISMQSLFGEKRKKGTIGEVLSGIAGAILGGISSMYLITQRNASFTVFSYVLAFIGAFAFLILFNMISSFQRK